MTSSDKEEEDLALALRLSQLSSDGFDEQVAQLHSEASGCTDRVPPSTTPRSGDEDDAVQASSTQRRSSNEQDDDDVEWAVELLLELSLLPADPDEQRKWWADLICPMRMAISLDAAVAIPEVVLMKVLGR